MLLHTVADTISAQAGNHGFSLNGSADCFIHHQSPRDSSTNPAAVRKALPWNGAAGALVWDLRNADRGHSA